MNIEYEEKENKNEHQSSSRDQIDLNRIIDELDQGENTTIGLINPIMLTKKEGRNEQDNNKNMIMDKPIRMSDLIKLDNLKLASAKRLYISGIEVLFPYHPYECQITYMKSIIDSLEKKQNALLQSPTGTGKTLCLLCATLAWLKHYREKCSKNPSVFEQGGNIRIIYSSRTHSQLKQVVKELKATCYRPIMSVLGSREQMCVKPEFKGLTSAALTANCKKARTSRFFDTKCSYFDNLSKNESSILNKFHTTLFDVEELRDLGQSNNICPYFYERKLEHKADIILMPYNYLLDRKIRNIMEIKLENTILIFDEAHNIEGVCEEGVSFELSIKDLENCENDEKLLRIIYNELPDECKIDLVDIESIMQPINALKKNFVQWRKTFESNASSKASQYYQPSDENKEKGVVYPGTEIFDIFREKTKTQKNSYQTNLKDNNSSSKYNDGLNESNILDYLDLIQKVKEELSTISSSRGGLDHFSTCLSTMYSLLNNQRTMSNDNNTNGLMTDENKNQDWIRNKINSYVVYAHVDKDDPLNFILSFWCLNPGIGFNQVTELNPRSILLTSGTLAPFKSFESELMTSFHNQLINKHVIDTKKQVFTAILKKGSGGISLNFSYENRNSINIIVEAGNSLITLAQAIPNGILVFFASYFLMQKCMSIWDQPEYSILTKLRNIKSTYQEPRNSNDLRLIMSEYITNSKTKGAIFFAVCRGKVSEGIDFADEMARAVVLIGIPYPAVTDKRVELKKKFLTECKTRGSKIGGNEWYFQQTIRAVNQAIGRSIRHVNDYGTILLMDERYSGKDFMNEYPGWIKDNLEHVDKFGFAIPKLSSFFKDRQKLGAIKQIITQKLDSKDCNGNNDSKAKTKVQLTPSRGLMSQVFQGSCSSQGPFNYEQGYTREDTVNPGFSSASAWFKSHNRTNSNGIDKPGSINRAFGKNSQCSTNIAPTGIANGTMIAGGGGREGGENGILDKWRIYHLSQAIIENSQDEGSNKIDDFKRMNLPVVTGKVNTSSLSGEAIAGLASVEENKEHSRSNLKRKGSELSMASKKIKLTDDETQRDYNVLINLGQNLRNSNENYDSRFAEYNPNLEFPESNSNNMVNTANTLNTTNAPSLANTSNTLNSDNVVNRPTNPGNGLNTSTIKNSDGSTPRLLLTKSLMAVRSTDGLGAQTFQSSHSMDEINIATQHKSKTKLGLVMFNEDTPDATLISTIDDINLTNIPNNITAEYLFSSKKYQPPSDKSNPSLPQDLTAVNEDSNKVANKGQKDQDKLDMQKSDSPSRSSNTTGFSCMICYEAYTSDRIMEANSKCGHTACQTCWRIWLKTKPECPMCKVRIKRKNLVRLHLT